MKKAVITIYYNKNNNAGPKAQTDVVRFLADKGYENITLPFNVRSKFGKLKYAYYDLPRLFRKSHYDIVLFQYPIFSEYIVNSIIRSVRKYTQAKLFFITHDIDTLRAAEPDLEFQKREIEQLNSTDGLIIHNKVMKKWLSNHGVNVPMVDLNIFDYDNSYPINKNDKYEKTVCFAGNFEKAPFLEKIKLEDTHLDLYGSNPANPYQKGIKYHGQFTPDNLLSHLTQNFGLVWDGNSIETCSGRYGNYLRYNDPHKASLYLSSGMPIIIWNKAALADFVKHNHVGIGVDSLTNLDNVLDNISQEEYKKMKKNCIKMATQLRNGDNIKRAIESLERRID